MLGLQSETKAQTASTYSFAAISGTYTYLSGGTSVSSILDDDATSAAIPIGFTFNYCGTGYTQLKACSNGWLTFNTAVSSSTWTNSTSSLNTIKPALMPWFDDMEGYFGTASYATTGSAGSRVFTFEYKNWDIDWSYDYNISIQVKLYEATGVIQYIYKQEPGYYSGFGSGTIGIGDGSATPTYLSLNGFGTAPTASSTTFTTSLNGRPANGQIYQFTPPSGCVGTPTAGLTAATSSSVCLGGSTTLSLPTATSGGGISYQWQSSPDGIVAYTNISGATSSTYVATPTAPTFYRCVVTCSSGPTSVNSTPIQITFANSVTSTTSNFRCGTGTVNLSATGSAGTTLKWYAAATGGASLGSGSPFTTPTIATTTNYFVGAEVTSIGVAQIGSGTSLSSSTGYPTAFGNYWYQDWQQIVYTAAELNAAGIGAGDITALAMNISGLPGPSSVSGYSIRIGSTTASTLSSFTTTGLTTVFGPSTVTPSSGWNTITFATPYNWDGTSNIIVDIRGNGAYGWANATTQFTTTSGNTCLFAFSFSSAPVTFYTSSPTPSASTSRPNIRFTGNLVCSSPRSLVTATVNTPPSFAITGNQTICNNSVATLNVTSTLSSYNTYTWSPATNLFTDAACTVAYTAGSSASTVYFKTTTAGANIYTCTANNSSTLCASTATTTVTNLPSTVTVSAQPSSLCFSGNVALTITPGSYGAAQFQWQTSADNSIWGDSTGMISSSLTSNVVSNTRYYRLVLRSESGVFCLNATSDTALVFKPSIVTVTNGVRCAPGTVVLGATNVDGIINWFNVPSGGTSLGSGTSFTTPFISSTSTYYAEVTAVPEVQATIGTGTLLTSSFGYPTAFGNYWYQDWQQIVYTAAELTAAGLSAGPISSMAMNITGLPSPSTVAGYNIRIGTTTSSTLSAFTTTGLTNVFGPSSISPVSGWNTITFSTPYTWDGVSNIIVDIRGNGAYGSANATTAYTATTGNTCLFAYTFSSTIGTAFFTSSPTPTATNLRPNIRFNRPGCFSSRSPVVATVNPLPIPSISPATGPIQICAGNLATFTGGGGGTYQWRDVTDVISGATSSTFSTGTTGSYRVIVTNPTTGCKDSSVAVAVNVNPVPTVSITPALTTAICADSSQRLTSIITGTGLTYQWFRGGTAIASATTDSLRVNTSGVYSLRVYLGSCSDTSNDATIVVNPLPSSSFTKTGTTGAICLGSTLELTALSIPTTSTYQWSRDGIDIPGATSQKYNAAIGGVYTVRIKDNNNCRRTSDTMKVINTPMGVPNLLPKDLRFCEGTVVKLYANAGPFADSFAWTKNGLPLSDTTPTIETGDLGYYAVTVTDVYGCTLTSTTSTITVDPLPIKPVINKIGSILSTANPYASYQWYRNGKIIVGATSRSYTISFDGDYHVVVTSSQGCKNISDVLSVQNLSVKQIARDGVKIDLYPNPAQSMINIDAPIDVNLVIRDIQGKQIMELKNAQQVDMSAYADGIYIFTLTDKDGVVVKMDKVVKRTN